VQADHRTGVVVGTLRALHLAAVAEREVHMACAVEDDAAAEVLAARALGRLAEKHLHILEAVSRQAAARELGAHAVLAARREREVDQLIVGELRMQHHVLQSALPVHGDFRQAADRRRMKRAVGDQPQPAGLFRDQHAPVGQEGERPRLLQALDERDHAKRVLVGAVGLRNRWKGA
jgi:hypothetical protein